MKLGYTTILHEPRIKLGLTTNEYCLCDTVYRLSTNPKAVVRDWCNARKDTLGMMIGVTKQSVITLIKKMVDKGLIRKSDDGRLLKTTDKWIDNVLDFNFTQGKESLPMSVKKVYRNQGKESLPYNNSSFNKNNNISKRELKFKEEIESTCSSKFPQLPKEEIEKFCDYWTEPNRQKSKMLFETKPTWDNYRRLKTWGANYFKKLQKGSYSKSVEEPHTFKSNL